MKSLIIDNAWSEDMYVSLSRLDARLLRYDEFMSEPNRLTDFGSCIYITPKLDIDKVTQMMKVATSLNLELITCFFQMSQVVIGPVFHPGRIDGGCIQCLIHRLETNKKAQSVFGTIEAQNHYRQADYDFLYIKQVVAYAELLLQRQMLGNAILLDEQRLNVQNITFQPYENCTMCANLSSDALPTQYDMDSVETFTSSDSYRIKAAPTASKMRRVLCDNHAGMLHHVYRNVNSGYAPMVGTEFYMSKESTDVLGGYGRGSSYTSAETGALLESVERYVNGLRRQGGTVRSSFNKLKEHAVDPRCFILHDRSFISNSASCNVASYGDDIDYDWVWGYSLRHNKPVLIPEQLVYYFDNSPQKAHSRFVRETSNGGAIGGSLQEAVFYGLLEVIERDAFLVTWYGKLSVNRISTASIDDPESKRCIDTLVARGLNVYLFDITTESRVPAIWALIMNPRKDAPLKSYTAAAAHVDPDKAVSGALTECITAYGVYEASLPALRERAQQLNANFDLVSDMEDHVLMYSIDESIQHLQFVLNTNTQHALQDLFPEWFRTITPQRTLTHYLKDVTQKLLKHHDDVLFTELRAPVLQQLGLYGAKVHVPGMLPMTFGHAYTRIDQARIQNIVDAGIRTNRFQGVNPVPHPFP